MNFSRWLIEPVQQKDMFKFWFLSMLLVLFFWTYVPIVLFGANIRIEFLEIKLLSVQNLAVISVVAIGEEGTFRVLPIWATIYFFKNNLRFALIAGIIASYFFGLYHEWLLTNESVKMCLGFGGIVLIVVYLKFGGAYKKPFDGLMACASIHGVCNLLTAVTANIIISLR